MFALLLYFLLNTPVTTAVSDGSEISSGYVVNFYGIIALILGLIIAAGATVGIIFLIRGIVRMKKGR